MSELLLILLRTNLAVAAAVALVMTLRLPVRRLFGARVGYGLWSLAPLAALAMLLPARVMTVPAAAQAAAPIMALEVAPPGLQLQSGPDLWLAAGVFWIAGGLVSLAWLGWRRAQFGRAVRAGRAGPAVVGILAPRIVTPLDFGRRYTPREQLVVLAHEATHIARHDCRINAAVALARCLNWFNPAIHLAAHYLRIDQELACDAQVVAAHPTARRSYAEAMLKTQLAARPLPLGCYWPAQSAHPLAERIRLLARQTPGRARRRVGTAIVVLLGLGAAWSAWAARPAEIVRVPVAVRAATPPAQAVATRTPPVRGKEALKVAAAPEPLADVKVAAATEAGLDAQAPALELEPPAAPETRVWKIRAIARRSAVEPGSAVRVLATMTDPDGLPLTTDLTAFGSQQAYRSGYFQRNGSRYALFTSVLQQGDRLWVTASLNRRLQPPQAGTIALRSGETGNIVLGNGQVVTVTPTLRAETPEEVEEGKRATRNLPIDPATVNPWRGYPR